MELRQGTEGVWVLGFRSWGAQGEEQNGLFLALNPGNVATFGVKSRRYREDGGQRRDVRGNVATLGVNVVTLQRGSKINVATLITHVAMFQRV